MCKSCHPKEQEIQVSLKKYRLADFFGAWWTEYCKAPTRFIEPWQYKAVAAILVCRTAALGIDYYACPSCGEMSEIRHNCRNRFCPTCSWLDTVKWADKIKSEILNIPHRHVVFTLPHKLNPLIRRNARDLYQILQRVSADTFKDWMRKKYKIKTGVISVLHTFGEKKNLHVHVHMIVAWGGLDIETKELKIIEPDYVKYSFLQKKFRNKFEDELVALFNKGELKNEFEDELEFKCFLKKINDKNWQIHLEPPMATPADVIRYIGRYSKRACLSEYKITKIEGEYITFRYKDYKDREDKINPKSKAKEKELCCHYTEFFPLLLQHVPLPNFRLVKYYGAYARFKEIPEQYKTKEEAKALSQELTEEYQQNENNPKYCKGCTCAKVYVETLIDTRPKQQRRETFDINKHEHLIYIKLIKQVEQRCVEIAA